MEWNSIAEIQIAYEEIELKLRKPNTEELQRDENQLAAHELNNLKLGEHGFSMIYAREQLLLNEYPDVHNAALQTVRIGNQIIIVSGDELFNETGR